MNDGDIFHLCTVPSEQKICATEIVTVILVTKKEQQLHGISISSVILPNINLFLLCVKSHDKYCVQI